jgi:aldose 1-epimerase
VLEVRTSTSGMWFETGNFMDQTLVGKQEIVYDAHVGFTLAAREVELSKQTLYFPEVPLLPEHVYSHTIVYKFFAM